MLILSQSEFLYNIIAPITQALQLFPTVLCIIMIKAPYGGNIGLVLSKQ